MDARDIDRLAAFQDETDPTVRDGWAIENIGSLEWALSRLADLEAEAHENKAALAAAHAALARRAAQLEAQVQRGVEFFRASILSYADKHRGELLKGGAKKSRTLLYGTVGWRKAGGRLKVVDKDALAAWVSEQSVQLGLYRVKVEPEMKALQDYCRAGGMVPPGTEWELEHETAFVKAISPGTSLVKTKTEGSDDEE